jgi:NAD(P)-dependent dehydrogenase (short-subunit alcohol dehydrogenase family)
MFAILPGAPPSLAPGSGVGEALALALARRSWTLLITDNSEERLNGVAKAATDLGATVQMALFDVADVDGSREAPRRFWISAGLRPFRESLTMAARTLGGVSSRRSIS